MEKINPALVTYDTEGKPLTVRYKSINAMLLNELLKEHRKVEEQQTTITRLNSAVVQQLQDFQAAVAEQQKAMEAVMARLGEHAAQIQKVSAQLETTRPSSQTAFNNN